METGAVTMQDVVDVANQVLWMTVLLSMPTLLVSLVIGVLISLVQTMTGVQEMTLTFVPKLLAVFLVMAVSLPWTLNILGDYTREVFALMAGARAGR